MKKLKNIYHENNVIGVLSFWLGECAWMGNHFGRKYGIKHFCWIRGQDAKKGNRFVKKMHPGSNELITLSDFLQAEFEKNYQVKPSHIIPSGIDIRQFSAKIPQKDIDILGAGSLIPLKQFDIFLDTIHELKKNLPGIRAVLCGKGPEEGSLQSQIDKLQLRENVALIGEIPHHEVLYLMQRSKVFLHTSSYEGFGMVCLEALCAGAHVVSFVKPMNEEIQHWNIANSKETMQRKTLDILHSTQTEYAPVLPYTIDDTVKKITHLFGL